MAGFPEIRRKERPNLREGTEISPTEKQDEFSFFRRLPWAKIVTWSAFLGLVYTLRSLFAVIFITFVTSYICRNIVKFLVRPFGERWYIRKIIVVVTFLLLLFSFYLGGRFLVPNIVEQGRQVVNTVRDLRLHEGGEGALPRLYATLRFWFYKNSDDYEEDLMEFREGADPVKLEYEDFQYKAGKIRENFQEEMVIQFGETAYERGQGTQAFRDDYNAFLEETVEKEYLENQRELEIEKETELRGEMSEGVFKRFKNKYDTPEAWSEYLKNQILFDLYKEIDGNPLRKREFEDRFKERYVIREGEKAVQGIEGTPEWEALFRQYFEALPSLEWSYEEFVRFENASDEEEYIQLVTAGEEFQPNLARYFKEKKEREFSQTFKASGIVEELNQRAREDFLPGVARWVGTTIEYTVTLAFHLILSVFLSFFIVWDIPRLKWLVGRLENSRAREFYREVLPGLVSFGWLMGRAFQAQALIALVNTGLTFSALNVLDVPHRAFLCAIVFICSFIPVVGVVISSIPMVVVALQLPDGLILALELVGCVLIIHFIETTLLNPKIMGDMLKLHPLLVLVILLVGEHFFGVWGLLLGVPIAVYIFRFVILRDLAGLPLPNVVKEYIHLQDRSPGSTDST